MVKRDHRLNSKLLHQVQSLSKIVTKLVLPHVMHVYPLDLHECILLALDYIQIDENLLLVPEHLSSSEHSPRSHIGIDPPVFDILRDRNPVHALSRFLLLAGSGLDIALGGIGALWGFILGVAQTLGASVTTGIGT